jgi:two-component system, LytTR family, sensor kinase
MNLFARATFRITFIGMLLCLATVHCYIVFNEGYSVAIAGFEAACSAVLLFFLCYVQSNILSYYAPRKQRQLFVIAWAIMLAVLWLAGTYFCCNVYFDTNLAYITQFKHSMVARGLVCSIFISAVGLYNLLWEALQYQSRAVERDMELAQMATDAELFKLRQQIQPHFLFNSLNSINALVGGAPKEARDMVLKLSEFLRATLKREERELISLEEELNYISLYLDIERVRFGDRLEVLLDISNDSRGCALPNLLLQPLIENAIKFGLYNTLDVAHIAIVARRSSTGLKIRVTNTADSGGSTSNAGTGFGLQSTTRRLQLVYGRADLLHTRLEGEIYIVELLIPQL